MKTIKQAVLLSLALGSAVAIAQSAPVADYSSGQSGSSNIDKIERILEQRAKELIEVQRTLDTLAEEVAALRGENEVHAHQLEQLVERQRELYQELEERFSRFSANQSQQPTTVTQTPAVNSPQSSAPATEAPEVVYSGSVSENEAYDRAMNLVLKERKYDQAIPEFRAFIKTFPESDYAPNAYYWLGQLLFNKGEYPGAKTQFEQVVNYFPDSNKRSDAILKLGSIALKNNDMAGAKAFFEKVVAEYPGSTSAKLAASRLEGLN